MTKKATAIMIGILFLVGAIATGVAAEATTDCDGVPKYGKGIHKKGQTGQTERKYRNRTDGNVNVKYGKGAEANMNSVVIDGNKITRYDSDGEVIVIKKGDCDGTGKGKGKGRHNRNG